MNYTEVSIFIIYLLAMVAIGLYFFFKEKNSGEKTYFLGNRQMGAWVGALSAGASDMSAWVLMGLPTSIYALGVGQVWIPVGLAIGYALSWIFEAPRLRKFSIVANDSITIPQYLNNRFLAKSKTLQIVCAIVFLLAYTIYSASSIKACGTLFHTVIGIPTTTAMTISVVVIVSYTFFGGFSAVCWTDFFQGLLILLAMLTTPIFASFALDKAPVVLANDFWNPFSSWQDIVSGLGWGLGYFGMPHIIVRFMSIRSQKELRKSSVIGISWTVLIVIFAALIGIVGRTRIGLSSEIQENELVFVQMVRMIFPSILAGIMLSAVLAASMSTADSQLLAASSAFSSDVYKPVLRRNSATDKELLWVGRLIVLVIAIIAYIIAANPKAGSIMSLVSNAWGVFGAAFGPVIILNLYWKRFNYAGAIAGILSGTIIDIAWLKYFSCSKVYEIIPGFVGSLIIAVIVTLLTRKPSEQIEKLYDEAIQYTEAK